MSKRKSGGSRPDTPSWSVPVAVTDIPEIGKRVELVADAPVRAAIAATAGLAELSRLEAAFDLTRHGRDGVRVAGRVVANIVQNCVVTLEPLPSRIAEDIDLVFLPPAAAASDSASSTAELPEDRDPPETLDGETIDLGALAAEFLLLGIDPYPRKEGATFDAPPAGDPVANPFAALAALKKGPAS